MTEIQCYNKYKYLKESIEKMNEDLCKDLDKLNTTLKESEFASVEYITAWTERTTKITMCARLQAILKSIED